MNTGVIMESDGVTDIIGFMKRRFNKPATSSIEVMEPVLETSTSGKTSPEGCELDIDVTEENNRSTQLIEKLETDTVVKGGADILQSNSLKTLDETHTPKRTRHRSNSRSVIQNAIARKEKSLRVYENPKYRRNRTNKKILSASEPSSLSIKKQLLQRKSKLAQTNIDKNLLISPESSDECNENDGNIRRSQRILISENKSLLTSELKEEEEERAQLLARLCRCNENKQLYMESESDSQFCTAVDSINEKLIGCSRLVDVRTVPMLRPSTRVPFSVYCESHKQRLIRHNCCPTCGQFCTQGQFAECKLKHHFHKDCKLSIGDREYCPHCGDCCPSTDVIITMHSSKKPVFLPIQRSHHPSARISFKDTKDVSSVCNGREESVTSPIIPKEQMDLLQAHASTEINECNEHGLLEAVKNNDSGKVAAILGNGKIDMKIRLGDCSNGTFLHLAVLKGSLEIVYLLVSNHIDIDALDSDQSSALMLAAMEHKNDIVRYLVKAGADVSLKGMDGMTCLHIAAKSGNLEACKVFLDFRLGISNFVNTQDDGGWTPLVWACEHGYCDVAKYLVSKGADVNIRDVEHNVALHWAAFKGSSQIVELLLNLKSDINVLNVHGDTPLHISSREDHYNCVIILLSRKADISIINKNNESPLECASKEGSCYSLLALNAQLHLAISGNSLNQTSLLVNDISRGRELNPIQCCNSVDAEEEPRDYIYIKKNCHTSDSIRINMKVTTVQFCSCNDRCNSLDCKCARMSLKCWYDDQGKLTSDFNFCDPPLIFECNDFCSCNAILCSNRLVQKPLAQRFELFKTVSKGWGIKTLNFIATGNYVCEYLGELLTDSEAERREDDSYLFDLDNREMDSYCIDAKYYGNFARFINHSCEPNLHPVKVFVEHHDLRFPRIALFAKRDIAADEELCFDYGEKFWLVKYKSFTCNCGTETCKYSKNTIESTLRKYQMAV